LHFHFPPQHVPSPVTLGFPFMLLPRLPLLFHAVPSKRRRFSFQRRASRLSSEISVRSHQMRFPPSPSWPPKIFTREKVSCIPALHFFLRHFLWNISPNRSCSCPARLASCTCSHFCLTNDRQGIPFRNPTLFSLISFPTQPLMSRFFQAKHSLLSCPPSRLPRSVSPVCGSFFQFPFSENGVGNLDPLFDETSSQPSLNSLVRPRFERCPAVSCLNC